MSLSNYAEDYLLDYLLTGTIYVELHTGDPGEDGTADASGEGRQSCTFAASSGGIKKNNTAPSWTATIAQTITHISLWDAVSGVNCLYTGELLDPLTVGISDPITFSANKIVTKLT